MFDPNTWLIDAGPQPREMFSVINEKKKKKEEIYISHSSHAVFPTGLLVCTTLAACVVKERRTKKKLVSL